MEYVRLPTMRMIVTTEVAPAVRLRDLPWRDRKGEEIDITGTTRMYLQALL